MSKGDLPKSVRQSVLNYTELSASISKSRDILNSLIDAKEGPLSEIRKLKSLINSTDEDIPKLSNIEEAKLYVSLAYTLASLTFMKLNTKGQDISTHKIHDELKRIKSFVALINEREKIEAANKEKNDSQDKEVKKEEDNNNKRKSSDVEVSNKKLKK